MKDEVAPVGATIWFLTSLYVVFFLVMLYVSIFTYEEKSIWIITTLIGVLGAACFLRSPVSYEITPDNYLKINFRIGSKKFGPIKQYNILPKTDFSFYWGIRLWANGGLFSISGIFYNKKYGVFRAYMTRSSSAVAFELENGKFVAISPANIERWKFSNENSR